MGLPVDRTVPDSGSGDDDSGAPVWYGVVPRVALARRGRSSPLSPRANDDVDVDENAVAASVASSDDDSDDDAAGGSGDVKHTRCTDSAAVTADSAAVNAAVTPSDGVVYALADAGWAADTDADDDADDAGSVALVVRTSRATRPRWVGRFFPVRVDGSADGGALGTSPRSSSSCARRRPRAATTRSATTVAPLAATGEVTHDESLLLLLP